MLPGDVTPQIHDLFSHLIRLIIITPVFRRFILCPGLQYFMPLPVVFQGLDKLGHSRFLFVKYQIFDCQKRIDRGGIGDGLKGG